MTEVIWKDAAGNQKTAVTLDTNEVEAKVGTMYPPAFSKPCEKREKKVLGDRFGLSQFGVNLTILQPGVWSARRHWHTNEDEFVYVVDGELVLIDDEGEHVLKKGMCAGFPAGDENGHHLVNKSDQPASYIEIGSRVKTETAYYPDDDLVAHKTDVGFEFTNREGETY